MLHLTKFTIPIRRGLWAVAAAMACGLAWMSMVAAVAAVAAPGSSPFEVITQAKVLASNEPVIPDMAPQTLTVLPDDWLARRVRANGSVWYRAAFETPALAQSNELLALYIERACSSVDVHLNGRRIFSSGGSLKEPASRGCLYPQLVSLPSSLLREGGNVLDLRVNGHALPRVAAVQRSGGLSSLKIGPQVMLALEYESAQFWRVTAVEVSAGVLGVLGCVLLLLGWPVRRKGHEWLLGGVLLGWAVLSMRLWARDLPMDHAIVEFLASSGLALLAALAVVFLLRYARWTYRPVELLLWVQCLLVPMSMLIGGPNRLNLMASAWTLVLSLEVLAAMGLYLALAWPHRRRADFLTMAPICAVTVVVVGMELLVQQRLLDPPAIDVTQLGLSLVLGVLAVRVLWQYSHGKSLGSMAGQPGDDAQARQSLEARLTALSDKHEATLAELAELRAETQKTLERKRTMPSAPEPNSETERTLAQMAELRVEQVTAQERKRIAADLHDDLGAKLLTIVHTSESDRISTLAREALEEMRLSVRGLTGKPMRLADALADWRAETVARLGQANIEIDWRSPTEETEQRLAARSFVQTTRILREAVSNVIKHSGASQCKVRCGIREGEFGLVVQDNGNGISMELDGKLDRGHGMASMKNRAKQMQGQCLVESGPGYGTVIRLTLPL